MQDIHLMVLLVSYVLERNKNLLGNDILAFTPPWKTYISILVILETKQKKKDKGGGGIKTVLYVSGVLQPLT